MCREEAVRLLRSTRMSRANSEGAYSSDFDYERYHHAAPLLYIRCIRRLVVLPEVVPVYLSVTVQRDDREQYPPRLISVFCGIKKKEVITALLNVV